MKYPELRERVCEANKLISKSGLALFTWGNASEIDRTRGIVAIKPSGVDYADLKPADIVLLDLKSGAVCEGKLKPSSDTPTHLHLYRNFTEIGGVVHTHSHYATAWAQACRELPCFGTTHADYFYGSVPLTRQMTKQEIKTDYEKNTGVVIVERFARGRLNPSFIPGVLVACHGPFAWGGNAARAVENALVLEEVARLGLNTISLAPARRQIPQALLDKHFLRKHGAKAYYGQTAQKKV